MTTTHTDPERHAVPWLTQYQFDKITQWRRYVLDDFRQNIEAMETQLAHDWAEEPEATREYARKGTFLALAPLAIEEPPPLQPCRRCGAAVSAAFLAAYRGWLFTCANVDELGCAGIVILVPDRVKAYQRYNAEYGGPAPAPAASPPENHNP